MQKDAKLKLGRPLGATTFDPTPARAFGAVIRTIRLELKISQEELSNLAEVERSHMGKIERGEHMPNFVLILRLAKALQVRPGELVDKAVALM
jgi:transcriptional regulator with XRE-family HTH domain